MTSLAERASVVSVEEKVYEEVKHLISHELGSTNARVDLLNHLISQLIAEKREEIETCEIGLKSCHGDLERLQGIGQLMPTETTRLGRY